MSVYPRVKSSLWTARPTRKRPVFTQRRMFPESLVPTVSLRLRLPRMEAWSASERPAGRLNR